MTVRLEEWRVKRRDIEEWMRHRQLPPDLQDRVRRFVQYKWLATRGVDEESILRSLPLDIRREIQRHLCLALVRRVSPHAFSLNSSLFYEHGCSLTEEIFFCRCHFSRKWTISYWMPFANDWCRP